MAIRLRFNRVPITEDTQKTPDEMYQDYLSKHIQGVKDVYNNIIKPVLIEDGVDNLIIKVIEMNIDKHDHSKYSLEEWEPYRNYFYDNDRYPRSSEAFSYAWNHHQKTNPHHWQFWCLINDVDEPQVQPLDMPLEYIIEMLCDWQSAGHFYGNTAYTWYTQHKDRMIMTDHTRQLVEKYIEYLKE